MADAPIAEYDKLKPGFVVVNDIRQLRPTTHEATEQMRRAQKAAVQLTHMQWSRTLKAAHGREAETATTPEEAERMLEAGGGRSAVRPEPGRRPWWARERDSREVKLAPHERAPVVPGGQVVRGRPPGAALLSEQVACPGSDRGLRPRRR